jgi:hypothetical protein
MGILFDLLVDAACKGCRILGFPQWENCFSTLFGTGSPNIVYEGTKSLSGHSTVAR